MILFGLFFVACIIAIYIVMLAFMFWMMVDAAKHDKFWWLVLCIALPVAGAVIYFFVEKKKMYEKIEKHTEGEHAHHAHAGHTTE